MLAVLGASALAACAGLPSPANTPGRNYRGRFSLVVSRTQASGQAQRNSWSGRFALSLAGQAMSLDLVSPLGATIARFETDPLEARLLLPADGGVQVSRGADAKALSERVMGWSLPLDGMPDWLQGRPAAARPYRTLPADSSGGRRFEQDGWAVTVHDGPVDGQVLRLDMDRAQGDGLPGVDLRVILDGPAS